MKSNKLFLVILIALISPITLSAYDFATEGFYYDIIDETDKTVAVTRGSSSESYSGSIKIPPSVIFNGDIYKVIKIGASAFRNCTGLTSVTIGNSVTEIGSYAFSNCTGLTEVTIGNSVTSIGDDAFSGCSGLTSVTIGNSVTSIGDDAFYNCSGLTEVNISDLSAWCKIDFGGSSANPLYYAKKLKLNGTEIKDLVIPNDITKIKAFAFYSCTGLTSVNIPNSVSSIGNYAFEDCDDLTEVNITDLSAWCKIDFGNSYANPLYYANKLKLNGTEIKDLVIPNDITEIKDYAFNKCTGLTSVTIPNSVTTIGSSAFSYCTGLTSVTIPNSVTTIGSSAFRNTGLTSVTIPNSVTSIGSGAFEDCTGLTSVTIPNSVTSIGDYAFRNTGLTEVNFNAENCTSMGSSDYPVFKSCTKLKTLNIGNSVKTIPNFAFFECSGLTEVNFNAENCTSMGSSDYPVFKSCTKLKTLNIGNTVKTIPNYAFFECSGLTSVTIPNSVTEIGDYAFCDCSNLKFICNLSKLTLSKGSSSYGYLAYYASYVINAPNGFIDGDFVWNIADNINTLIAYCGNASKLILPNNFNGETYKIGDYAFSYCTGLTSVTIGNSVTTIGDYAFYRCRGLTSVTIPNSVTSIGYSAFYDCDLKFVTSYCMTPPRCYSFAFGGSYSAILKVPEGTRDLYANATVWEDFYYILEIAGVEDVLIDNVVVKIAVENGNISINGIENPHIEIYNLNGKCIYSGNDTTIPVSDTGVYILRINGKSYKIVNK